MNTTFEMDKIREKTEELCRLILEQPAFPDIKAKINSFLMDKEAQAVYDEAIEKQRALQEKQQQGLPFDEDEFADFQASREKLYANPVARDFLSAYEEVDKLQNLIVQYVMKTIELEKVPTEADLGGGCACGGGGACACGAN
jgi:cell fate (sporulation/competence/biofilm development) regulator YlbF (YheA/YmcA/DUF963 family)